MKLFAFDLDGTTLQNHIDLSDENRKALALLGEQGVILVPATGRSYQFMPQSIKEFGNIRYFITSNGAAIYDKWQDKPIYTNLISAEKALEVQNLLQNFNVYAEYYDDGKIKRESKYEKLDLHLLGVPESRALFFRKAYTPVESYAEELQQGRMSPEKINLPYVPATIYDKLRAELEKIEGIHLTSSLSLNLEINDSQCNKGNALRFLAEYLGIEQKEVVAIGDNSNDTEMISYAGVGIAMGNATDEIKAIANRVTTNCDENGLAKAINALL